MGLHVPLELVVQLKGGVASFMGALEGFQSGAVDFLVPLQVPLGRESRTAPWFSARERSRASVYDHVPIQLALLFEHLAAALPCALKPAERDFFKALFATSVGEVAPAPVCDWLG